MNSTQEKCFHHIDSYYCHCLVVLLDSLPDPPAHSMDMGNLNKGKKAKPTTTTALKVAPYVEDHYPQELKSLILDQIYLVKVPLNVKIVQQDLLHRKQFLKIL